MKMMALPHSAPGVDLQAILGLKDFDTVWNPSDSVCACDRVCEHTHHGGQWHKFDRYGEKRSKFWRALNPIWWVVVLTGVTTYKIYSGHGWLEVIGIFAGATLSIAVVGSLFTLFFLLLEKVLRLASGQRASQKEEVRLARLNEARAMIDRVAQDLVCSGSVPRVDLQALPPARRTIHLRYQNLKAKVCRPYAAR